MTSPSAARLQKLPEKVRAKIEPELLPGEVVLWAGAGQRTPRTHLITWGILLFYILLAALIATSGAKIPVAPMFSGMIGILIMNIQPAAAYVVTDRRILRFGLGGMTSFVPTSMPKVRVEGGRGAGTLLFDKGKGVTLHGVPDIVRAAEAIGYALVATLPDPQSLVEPVPQTAIDPIADRWRSQTAANPAAASAIVGTATVGTAITGNTTSAPAASSAPPSNSPASPAAPSETTTESTPAPPPVRWWTNDSGA